MKDVRGRVGNILAQGKIRFDCEISASLYKGTIDELDQAFRRRVNADARVEILRRFIQRDRDGARLVSISDCARTQQAQQKDQYQRQRSIMTKSPLYSHPVSGEPTTSGRASLFVLGAAAFLVQADARVIDALLHVVADDFHTVPAKASIVISSYALPYGLFQLFYGPIGDRIGKLRVTAVCVTLFAIGTFACGFVPNLAVFAVLRFLTGVAAAAVVPMSVSYIGDKFPYETRQIALGRFMSALMMGQIFASTIGGVFGQYLGWRDMFFALGAAALLASVVLFRESRRFAEPRKADRKPTAVLITQYGHLLKRRGALVVLGTVMIEGVFVFGGLAYLASSVTERFGVSTIAAGLMLAGFGIGGLIYSFSVKKLFARIGELGIFMLGGVVIGVAYVAIGLMPNWQSFLPLIILLGMGFYTMHGTLQTRATEIAPEARGTAISLFAFCFFMGQSLGPIALGRVVEWHGYSAAFVLAGLGLFALVLISRMLFVRIRTS